MAMVYDTIVANSDIFIPSVSFGWNNRCQNESTAEQKCGVSIPCSQRVWQKSTGDVSGAGSKAIDRCCFSFLFKIYLTNLWYESIISSATEGYYSETNSYISCSNLSQNLILLSETRQPNGEGTTTLIRRYQAVISLSINVEKLGTVIANRKKTFEIRKVYEWRGIYEIS